MPSTATKSEAEQVLDRLGFRYKLEPQFNLKSLVHFTNPDKVGRVQVREEYSPKDRVREYAILMANGVVFPPIVTTADRFIVDGNTRIDATLSVKGGRTTFPAFVLEDAYDGADDDTSLQIELAAAILNSGGAKPLTPREKRALAYKQIRGGATNEAIWQWLGMSKPAITAIRNEIAAAERMIALGISPNGDGPTGLTAKQRAYLGRSDVRALNDGPYKELVNLAKDAQIPGPEIATLAVAVKALPGDAEQIARIAHERETLRESIQTVQRVGAAHPPLSRQIRQVLGRINKYKGQELQLMENNEALRAEYVTMIDTSIGVLSILIELEKARV